MASDLFGFFDKMNRGDFSAVDKMSDDEVKGIAPFVLLGWMHGAQSNTMNHVILTDTYCNEAVFPLGKHPRLLLKCFVHANSGMGNTRYKFVKSVTKNESKLIKIVAKHYDTGYDKARDILRLLDDEDISILKDMYGEIET